jgi:redox-sensitive bicupin YhaK (pirin superfamily)
MQPRSILRAVSVDSRPAGGFMIARPLAALGVDVDPFLLVDWFKGDRDPFGPHPHAGFSAVTWHLPSSTGRIRNRDTLGDDSFFGPGTLHWFEAAHGAIHNETPDGVVEGLQIFVNLPLKEKHGEPRTYRAGPGEVPAVVVGDSLVRVVVGSFEGRVSPVVPRTPALGLLDIDVKSEVRLPIPRGHSAFVIVTDGDVAINDVEGANAAALKDDGDGVILRPVGRAGGHAVLFHGRPLKEPVFASGPFVMGNRDDLFDAMARYRRGEMGHLAPVDAD